MTASCKFAFSYLRFQRNLDRISNHSVYSYWYYLTFYIFLVIIVSI